MYESGSFGKVRLVKKKNGAKYSCVKIMKKEELIKSQQVDHISNEYKILSTISHPFIVLINTRRLTSKVLLKTLETFTCLCSMFLEESCLHTFVKRECLNLTKQRFSLIIQFLCSPYSPHIRIPAHQEYHLPWSKAIKYINWIRWIFETYWLWIC